MAKETLFLNTTQVLRRLQSQQCNFFLSTIDQRPSRNLRLVQACPLKEAKNICLDGQTIWKKRELKIINTDLLLSSRWNLQYASTSTYLNPDRAQHSICNCRGFVPHVIPSNCIPQTLYWTRQTFQRWGFTLYRMQEGNHPAIYARWSLLETFIPPDTDKGNTTNNAF